MIIKTLQVACDRDGCLSFYEGETGESRALVVIKQARAVGWEATDGRQFCPVHRLDDDDDEILALIDHVMDARAVGE